MILQTKPCRIALLFEYPTLLGGERSMLACVDWLQRHVSNAEFVAIAPRQGRLATALSAIGVSIIPQRLADSGTPREQIEEDLLLAVQQSQADLLHANSLAMGRLTGRIAGRVAIPTTAHLRDILNLSGTAVADLNQNRRLIAVSHATRFHHVAQGLDSGRVVVVHNGLDLEQFHPRVATGWLHRELQLPDFVRLIATIGQIGLRKGQDILALAAPDIVQRVPDVHFVLIGERSSGKAESIAFEQSIVRLFESHHIEDRLHKLGHRDDVPNVMAEIELTVHSANQEPFGRVLLEAAACGVAVVATNVGGTSEIVVDGVTGCLVPPSDPKLLAEGVIRLLTNNSLLQSMRSAARDRAVKEFDIARSAEHVLQHWHEVLGCAKSR